MIHHVNERIAIFDERHNTDISRVEARLDTLDFKVQEGFGQAGSQSDMKFQIDDLKQRVESCEKDDSKQDRDIDILQRKIDDELTGRINLIVKNRDDLLIRIEQAEQESARLNKDTRSEIDKYNEKISNQMGTIEVKQQNLISVVTKLEEDVRV